MSFGAKLRKLREAKGMPTASIDEVFSLMRGTCSNWENGYSKPEKELLTEIADFFRVPVQILTEEDRNLEMRYNPTESDK